VGPDYCRLEPPHPFELDGVALNANQVPAAQVACTAPPWQAACHLPLHLSHKACNVAAAEAGRRWVWVRFTALLACLLVLVFALLFSARQHEPERVLHHRVVLRAALVLAIRQMKGYWV
jgi:hypothetical protein